MAMMTLAEGYELLGKHVGYPCSLDIETMKHKPDDQIQVTFDAWSEEGAVYGANTLEAAVLGLIYKATGTQPMPQVGQAEAVLKEAGVKHE